MFLFLQLKQQQAKYNLIAFPTDSEYHWLLAKMFVKGANFNPFELSAQLLCIHLLSEVWIIKAERHTEVFKLFKQLYIIIFLLQHDLGGYQSYYYLKASPKYWKEDSKWKKREKKYFFNKMLILLLLLLLIFYYAEHLFMFNLTSNFVSLEHDLVVCLFFISQAE